jgi:hypothetical protein
MTTSMREKYMHPCNRASDYTPPSHEEPSSWHYVSGTEPSTENALPILSPTNNHALVETVPYQTHIMQHTHELAVGNTHQYRYQVQNTDHDQIHDGMRMHSASTVSSAFPSVLYDMLEDVGDHKWEHIVSWQPHGRAFRVHKIKKFVDIVLPNYFSQSKITSFQRQLNLYCFSRLTSNLDKGAYYHEKFVRGQPLLCQEIRRLRIKGNGTKQRKDPTI